MKGGEKGEKRSKSLFSISISFLTQRRQKDWDAEKKKKKKFGMRFDRLRRSGPQEREKGGGKGFVALTFFHYQEDHVRTRKKMTT